MLAFTFCRNFPCPQVEEVGALVSGDTTPRLSTQSLTKSQPTVPSILREFEGFVFLRQFYNCQLILKFIIMSWMVFCGPL